MRIVLAPDSFGGTLTAAEAADAIAAGWSSVAPSDALTVRPLSDGGPGFVAVLRSALGGDLLPVSTCDPLGRPVSASVLRVGTTAYAESAAAAGLHLLAPEERDPAVTTSYGVGLLVAAAVESGARTVVIGLGGSGTNDGGAGLLTALGVVLRDVGGMPLPYGGAALAQCARIEGRPALRGVDLVMATDVDNPLTGLHGASAVFGPQKGATREQVMQLDQALETFAEVVQREVPGCPRALANLPGAGAAGGLGAALLALGARREPGLRLVRELIGLDAALDAADLVLTGEGSFDFQSLRGKVVAGVAEAATERGLPCVVLAGQVQVGRREMSAAGVSAAYSVAEHAGSVAAAIAEPADRLRALAAVVAREWSMSRRS